MDDRQTRRRAQCQRSKSQQSEPYECDDPDHDVSNSHLPTHDANGIPYQTITASHLPVDIVLPRLRRVTGSGPTWSACCPAHGDSRPSLSVTETTDGKLLIKCHAGCEPEQIMSAIGLDMTFLFPSAYAIQVARRKGNFTSSVRGEPHDGPYFEPEIDFGKFKDIIRTTKANNRKLVDLANDLLYFPHI
jgi:hypothetical protein